MENVNWIAVAVAAFSTLFIGAIWYHPKVFGKAWMESVGLTEEDLKNSNMALIFGLAFVLAGVVAFKLSGGAYHHGEDDRNILHGAFHATLYALYFGLPVLIVNSLFERRSLKGILINAGYWVLCFATMGGVLYGFAGAGY